MLSMENHEGMYETELKNDNNTCCKTFLGLATIYIQTFKEL